jgi:hypothetical protein
MGSVLSAQVVSANAWGTNTYRGAERSCGRGRIRIVRTPEERIETRHKVWTDDPGDGTEVKGKGKAVADLLCHLQWSKSSWRDDGEVDTRNR